MSKHIIPHSCWRGTAGVMLLFHDRHLVSSQHKLFLTALPPPYHPQGRQTQHSHC